ncbi:MAG: acyltransferase family protein [Pseudomonadota bacterium]
MMRHYREDIDWLRAIAVISVLGFHWDITPFHGAGFVGVDIFFVISGFLITQIIQSEMAANEFSFARFYERRVRRLLPALYVMVVLAAIPSFYFLLPSERSEFFKSIAAVVTFTSNLFFWMQTGYFDRAADEKPLLHTWSLSVEEQFYLALPVLIWALLKWGKASRFVLPAGLGIAAVASFALAHGLMLSGQSATAFFLSPPRAWEFLAGSLVAMPSVPVIRNIHLHRIARFAGLGMIAGAVFGYRSYVSFPGMTALLPCAGTALFIWSGLGSSVTPRAVWSPLNIASFFGRISYSLYLWHWPLFIYAKFSKPSLTLTVLDKVALFIVAVALSYASYRFVEQPFRKRSLVAGRRNIFALAGVTSALLVAVSIWSATRGDSFSALDRRARLLETYASASYKPPFRTGQCFVGVWSLFDAKTCLTMQPEKFNVLLWGDSLGAQYYEGLRANADPARVNIMQATAEQCFPSLTPLPRLNPLCRDQANGVGEFLRNNKPDLVIVAADWRGYSRRPDAAAMMADLDPSLRELSARGIPVVVLGLPIQFRGSLPSMILRADVRHLDPSSLDDLVLPDIFTLDATMKAAMPSAPGLSYVSVLDAACPNAKCPVYAGEGIPLAFDQAHLTAEGSALVMRTIFPQLKIPAK